MFISISCYAHIDEDLYLQKIKNQKSISYKTLLKKYIIYLGDAKNNKPVSFVESGFYYNHIDNNNTAIDFHQTQKSQIIELSDSYGVILYNNDDFYKYAVLCDKDAIIKQIVLLAYREGNTQWQMKRDLEIDDRNSVIVTDKYYDTEWIIDFTKGENILSDEQKYIIKVSKDGHFTTEKTTTKKLYQVEDKRLNTVYNKSMKIISKKEQKELRNIQRLWIGYTDKKCNLFLDLVTGQEDNSIHIRSHKETKRRTDELENIYDYLDFYK
jgi:uncharacterized protein YecT (DUF1311 family)